MTSVASSARFTAAKADVVWPPRTSGLPLIVLLHGTGGLPTQWVVDLPSMATVASALCDAGFGLVAPSIESTWGNATSDARIDDAVAWGRANLRVHPTRAPVLIGASMGGAAALNYAADHATSAVVGLIPAIDLQGIRVADTVEGIPLRAVIDAAHGVTYPAALPAGTNPAVQTTALAQVHQQLWYATDDDVSMNIGTYASAVGADLRSVGALGHTDAAIAAASADDIVSFVSRRAL